jgi:ADP-heptose:LPS heptosyltransferase
MLALASLLGSQTDHVAPTLWIPETTRATLALRLGALGIPPGTSYCVLAVGSNRSEARLPGAQAAEVGRALHRETGLPILVTGDEGERGAAEELVGRIGEGSRSLAGMIDLHGLAALLEGARLVISTDSGPMHMAAALGAPLVALYGPSDPGRFGPRGNPTRIAVLQGCMAPRDPHRWHADITTAQVVDAAKAQLARPHPPENVAR